MTAQTTLSPLPESATTDHTHPIPQPDTKPGRTRRRRNDHGFSMLELLVGMVILGILGAIGYGIYTNFIGDARDTALDQNIQSAAAELQSVLALEPTLANTPELVTAMTNRTNFVWNGVTMGLSRMAIGRPDTIRYRVPLLALLRLSPPPPPPSRPSCRGRQLRRGELASRRLRRRCVSISPTPKANGDAHCW